MDRARAVALGRVLARALAWVVGATGVVLAAFVCLFVAGVAVSLGPRAAAVGAYLAAFVVTVALARATVA